MIYKLKKGILRAKILSKIYKKLFGIKIGVKSRKVFRQLKRVENMTEDQVRLLQNGMLEEMLKYAYDNTKYYKKLFDENSVLRDGKFNLRKIPYLTKDIIRSNTNDLISKKFKIEELTKRSTGGSTGEPMEFYCDTNASLLDNGHHLYLYSFMGYEKGDFVISSGGFEISEELRENNIYWKKTWKGNLFGYYMMSVLYLNEKTIDFYLNHILDLKPPILRGYPSFFDRLAIYILDNGIEVNFPIKGINLTSEICTKTQVERIEKAFNTMIFFEYGHKEMSLYCYTMERTYTYRSSPIYGYIEVLNDDGTDTEIGEIGNIYTTGFNNRGMPFIRYKTGDLGKISYRNGGVVCFTEIVGRSQDYLIDNLGNKIYLTATIYRSNLKAFKKFKRWQIIQSERGKATILIIKNYDFTIEDENEIKDFFKFFEGVDFHLKYVADIPKTKQGKHLFLIQKAVDANI